MPITNLPDQFQSIRILQFQIQNGDVRMLRGDPGERLFLVLGFSANGEVSGKLVLVSGGRDGKLVWWEVPLGRPLEAPPSEVRTKVWNVAFSPDLGRLALADGRTVRLLDATSVPEAVLCRGHSGMINRSGRTDR